MVAINAALTAGLMYVGAYITNPVLTPAVFNKWYSEVHVRDMLANNFSSIGLRYVNYTVGSGGKQPVTFATTDRYLALYDVPDIDFTAKPANMAKLPLNHEMLPDKNQPVMTWSNWDFTYWIPEQTYEGKSTATERPKFVLTVKIQPAAGQEADLDKWYRTEHLDMLSALPGYRRSTRYQSSNKSKPRFLAIHEVDDMDAFMAATGPSLDTAWAKKLKAGSSVWTMQHWQLFLNKGDTTEKLGTIKKA